MIRAPDPRRVHRDEAVHLAVELHVLDDLAAVRLERAAEVVERDARDAGDDPVGDPRRQHAHGVVLPVLAPAADDVVALVELLEQARDVVRIVLQVAVHEDEDLAAAVVDPRLHRGRLPEVAAEAHHAHVRIARRRAWRAARCCRRGCRRRCREPRTTCPAPRARRSARREAARRSRPRCKRARSPTSRGATSAAWRSRVAIARIVGRTSGPPRLPRIDRLSSKRDERRERFEHAAGQERRASRPVAWWIFPTVPLIAAAIAFAWTLHGELQRLYGMTGSAWDLAYDQQVIWNISVGQGFYSSFARANFLGIHFELIFVVLAAVEKLWANPAVLLIFSSAGLAATAPAGLPVLPLILPAGRAAESPWLAVALSAPIPFWAAIQEAARDFFHPENMALALALARGVGRHPRPSRVAMWVLCVLVLTLQGGPGLHGRRDRSPDARATERRDPKHWRFIVYLAGGVVPHRHRDRPAALPQRRLHRLRLLPLALRPRSHHPISLSRHSRRVIPAQRVLVVAAVIAGMFALPTPGPALAAPRDPALPRRRAERAQPAERDQPPLRASPALPADRRRRRRRAQVPRDAFDQARHGAGGDPARLILRLGHRALSARRWVATKPSTRIPTWSPSCRRRPR